MEADPKTRLFSPAQGAPDACPLSFCFHLRPPWAGHGASDFFAFASGVVSAFASLLPRIQLSRSVTTRSRYSMTASP